MYGHGHQELRRRWEFRVAKGDVPCGRCGELLEPGAAFDLGHEDENRRLRFPEIRGKWPEHVRCNRRVVAHLKETAATQPDESWADAGPSREW